MCLQHCRPLDIPQPCASESKSRACCGDALKARRAAGCSNSARGLGAGHGVPRAARTATHLGRGCNLGLGTGFPRSLHRPGCWGGAGQAHAPPSQRLALGWGALLACQRWERLCKQHEASIINGCRFEQQEVRNKDWQRGTHLAKGWGSRPAMGSGTPRLQPGSPKSMA